MYEFSTTDGQTLTTPYSRQRPTAREVARFHCFDAFDHAGNRLVILTETVNFQSFQFNSITDNE